MDIAVTSPGSLNNDIRTKRLALTRRRNREKLILLFVLALVACAGYLLIDVNFANEKLFKYALSKRAPRLFAMLLTSLTIGGATIIFQSIINNRIVTPCLLGMNSLYVLLHTMIAFISGTGSILFRDSRAAFVIDLFTMGIIATLIYGYFFRLTNYNVLYVLLIGTVLTSFFGSIQSSIIRIMDPNEFDNLLSTLVAGFSNMNTEVLGMAVLAIAITIFFLRKELALLDVMTLGKNAAINLGIDYDKCVRKLLLGVTIFIAIATALVGPISFLGLLIANLSRQLLRTHKHTYLIAGSVLFGMFLLIGGQLIVEHIFTYTIPVSVFVTFGGGLYFLYLLLFKRGDI